MWDKIEGLCLNTLLVPVYWEQLEPGEGVFCYGLIDSLLDQARWRNMRLVLLWFGLWKNGESMYVPGWIKQDRGKFHAICYSPFGIEDLGLLSEEVVKPSAEVMAALNINPAVFETEGGRQYLGSVYSLLQNLEPLYLKYRGTGHIQSYVRKSETDLGICLRFGGCQAVIDYMPVVRAKPVAPGVIFELGENRFQIAGMMSKITFMTKTDERERVAVLRLQEGCVEKGEWIPARTLNGDDQMMNSLRDMPSCLYVEFYQY